MKKVKGSYREIEGGLEREKRRGKRGKGGRKGE